jgi:hypothetical protein|tara:strand:- start:807 stop:1538 length:732 start_codon:yes stop_codon:yes gene_type:complete
MSHFSKFPYVLYNFGNEIEPVIFQKLGTYVDIIDQVKDDITAYADYTVLDGERPDILSHKIYDDIRYYWLFFYVNDHIREQGWPLTANEAFEQIKKYYPNQFIRTYANWFNSDFKIGNRATGKKSGAFGEIAQTHPDLGQIIVKVENGLKFQKSEVVEAGFGFFNPDTFNIQTTGPQYEAVHHYEDADGKYVDIDPLQEAPSLVTPITFAERFLDENEKRKRIRIIKPDVISQIYSEFNKALK